MLEPVPKSLPEFLEDCASVAFGDVGAVVIFSRGIISGLWSVSEPISKLLPNFPEACAFIAFGDVGAVVILLCSMKS